jgi:tripartite-type tricarboxylate transporter receptor subunit TctC
MRKFLSVLTALSVAVGVPAAASAAEPYFKGKTITLLVGFSPGGGNDLFARVFDKLGQHIEGQPTIAVQNMPGAGSILAANYFVSQAPQDGTYLFSCSGNLLLRLKLGLDGAKAKLSEIQPLIASPMGRITFASSITGIKEAKDILKPKEPLILGVSDPIATLDAVMGMKLLGAEFKTITGYKGKAETRLAVERGELSFDGSTTPLYKTSVQPLINEGKAVSLFAQGLVEGDKLIRDPAAPDVPTIEEVYKTVKGSDPTGPAWNAYRDVVRAIGNGGKLLMIPVAAPPEARKAIEAGIEKLLQDPEFKQKADTILEGYQFNRGEKLVKSVAAVDTMSEDSLKWLKEFLAADYGMTFSN